MTDVGQGRHYLFTPEMTALRPLSDVKTSQIIDQ